MKQEQLELIESDVDIDPILTSVGEEGEDELEIDYLDKLTDVVTWSTDWTVESIVGQLDKENIDLNPSFQRRDAWNPQKKSRLIESIIYGLPVPQIVLAEEKGRKGKFIIVDGKQRLLTLHQFCSKKINKDECLVLKNLSNKKLNNIDFQMLEEKYPDLFNTFINQSIRSVIIKNWPSESFLYTIFFRLNSGSLGLSPQELRQALMPGEFMKFVDKFSQENISLKNILGLKKPDYRMRDIDLAIRYFAFKNKIDIYTGNYKLFLDETCRLYNSIWESEKDNLFRQGNELSEAIEYSISIFGPRNVFRKWKSESFESRMNRAIFDIMVYYFSNYDVRESLKGSEEIIKNKFIDLCKADISFFKSISSNTNNMIETSTRFIIWGNTLNEIKPDVVSVYIPRNLLDAYSAIKNKL